MDWEGPVGLWVEGSVVVAPVLTFVLVWRGDCGFDPFVVVDWAPLCSVGDGKIVG